MADPLLVCRDLEIWFQGAGDDRAAAVIRGLDLELEPGQVVALTGPSGAGKTLLARTLLGLWPRTARWSGSIIWDGRPLRRPEDWRPLRGRGMAMVLQEPRTALNPVLTVGDQVAEMIRLHRRVRGAELKRAVVDLLSEVRLPEPQRLLGVHAHQLSGGMRQRVLLACVLACDPRLIIADEPTSALDAATRGAVMSLLDDIRRRRGMAMLLISHDLDLVRRRKYQVLALEGGRLRAGAPPAAAGAFPEGAVEQVGRPARPVLEVRDLRVVHRTRSGRQVAAVAGVDLDLHRGVMVGLAGRSGCGKSSLAMALARHVRPAGGRVLLEGEDFLGLGGRRLRAARRGIQVLFQDPGGSLDPRQKVADIIREACAPGQADRWPGLLEEVGLGADFGARWPHQMSGGQRQRVALARCLAAEPKVLIADEPTTQQDPRTQEKIMDLLRRIMASRHLAVLMISHDLLLLRRYCAEVLVMLEGLVMERMPAAGEPRHPYTLMLMAGAASGRGGGSAEVPETFSRAQEICPFRQECPLATPACDEGLPPLRTHAGGHQIRCYEQP